MLEIDDDKVIKAISCCLADGEMCDKCSLQDDCSPFDATALRYALCLIKKLRQENGQLKRKVSCLIKQLYKKNKKE